MTIESRVSIAPSDSPLYGKTFISKGYGKPVRPPEKGTSIESRVSKAPSDHPLYGKTFICRGYGKPVRPPETVKDNGDSKQCEKIQETQPLEDVPPEASSISVRLIPTMPKEDARC